MGGSFSCLAGDSCNERTALDRRGLGYLFEEGTRFAGRRCDYGWDVGRFEGSDVKVKRSGQKVNSVSVKWSVAVAPAIAQGWMSSLFNYDEITFFHSERMVHLVDSIAQAVGLDGDGLIEAREAAGFHDLGKVEVPISILGKAGTLTKEEFVAVKAHSAVGADLILKASPDFWNIAQGVRTHHERLDGSGYPDGLKGEEIPILGRIIAVADVFDALTHPRPYRAGMFSAESALEFLEDNVGSSFDPGVVSALMAIVGPTSLAW
ncbi:MAG: HD-GYP domain-containing protein [Acidimicrobiaceae bacterium]|nr:HD-GYP domain-containing protein [Acidimicrobiaceae bacterium]